MVSRASMMLPEPFSLFAPTTTRGTTSTCDCWIASAKRFSTCCVTWNCGPPYARTCSSVARACAIPTRAIFSASASAKARICAACWMERWYSALPWLQFTFLDGGLFLAVVGLDLLRGDLARAQLGQDGLDLHVLCRRGGCTDQHF